jgi:hypothetical protein
VQSDATKSEAKSAAQSPAATSAVAKPAATKQAPPKDGKSEGDGKAKADLPSSAPSVTKKVPLKSATPNGAEKRESKEKPAANQKKQSESVKREPELVPERQESLKESADLDEAKPEEIKVGSDGPRAWYYIDEEKAIQGPFWSEEMHIWWSRGWIPKDLLVYRSEKNRPPHYKFYSMQKVKSFFWNKDTSSKKKDYRQAPKS